MNKRGKQTDAKTATRGVKLILIGIFLSTIIATLTLSITAEPTNETIDDTWFDTHWGGDTGNETYQEPAPPVIEEEPEPEPTNMCGLSIPVVGVCFTATGIWYAKKRRELKLE